MKHVIGLLVVVLTMASLVCGCSSEASTSESEPVAESEAEVVAPKTESTDEETEVEVEAKDHYVFGMTVMTDAAFFDAVKSGVLSVTDEHGDEVIYVSGKLDAVYQQSVIEDFIAKGVDLVFYNPADASASIESLKLLKEAGIPVINFDSRVADTSYVENFTGTDNYQAGVIAAEFMMEEHPEGGTYAIIDFPAAESATLRADGFQTTVEESGADWELVARLDGKNTVEGATKVTEDILTAHPDLTAFYVICDEMGQSVYSVIKASGSKANIYSLNAGPESKAAMREDGEDGIWRGSAAQSPIVMGKTIAEYAYQYLAGEGIPEETLIKTFIVCPANMDEYGDSDWQ